MSSNTLRSALRLIGRVALGALALWMAFAHRVWRACVGALVLWLALFAFAQTATGAGTFPSAIQIIYKATGSGATVLTVAQVLGLQVVPQMFGAKGDGTTDDTAAIQAAITAAGGGTVEFPRPSVAYKATSQINVSTAGTTLHGTGSKILVGFTDSTGGVLFNITASDVTVDGLSFDGGSATTSGASVNHYIIKVLGSSGTHLSNIVVRNSKFINLPWTFYPTGGVGAPFATHGTYVQYVDGLNYQNNVVDGIGGAAVFLSVVTKVNVLDNLINNTQWYSIQLNDQVDGALISRNRITGNLPKGRLWGGSVNLMSNSSTGGACGTPGCARIKHVEISFNYISGTHSYTAAIHIESSSYVSFNHNTMEGITLTYPSDFYATNTPPDYVRPYVRPLQPAGTGNEGPNDHIDISDNTMIADGPSCVAIYADNQANGTTVAASDTFTVSRNRIISTDTSNYFAKGVIVHGQDGGFKTVSIVDNSISGFPDSSSPVSGLIGTVAVTNGTAIVGVIERGNTLTVVGGTPSSTTHLAIAVDAFTQQAQVTGNYINGFWDGIRTFTNASTLTLTPNTITGSGHADYTFGVAPSVPTGTLARYGSLFLTGRGSALAASSVVVSAAVGEYRLCVTARTTTSGTGTTATPSLIWTDEGGVKTDAVGTWALNAVDVTGQINKCEFVHVGTAAGAAANIQVSVAGTFGTSLYAISATAEKLN